MTNSHTLEDKSSKQEIETWILYQLLLCFSWKKKEGHINNQFTKPSNDYATGPKKNIRYIIHTPIYKTEIINSTQQTDACHLQLMPVITKHHGISILKQRALNHPSSKKEHFFYSFMSLFGNQTRQLGSSAV